MIFCWWQIVCLVIVGFLLLIAGASFLGAFIKESNCFYDPVSKRKYYIADPSDCNPSHKQCAGCGQLAPLIYTKHTPRMWGLWCLSCEKIEWFDKND
jgi:hypothetical protein